MRPATSAAISAAAFIFSPALGFLASTAATLLSRRRALVFQCGHFLTCSLALLCGVIATSKVPEGDQINYLAMIADASHQHVYEVVFWNGREFLFNILIDLAAFLSFGSVHIGFGLMVALAVYLSGLAVLLICSFQNLPPLPTVALIFSVTIFGPVFNTTPHLLKQSLAMGFLLLGLVLSFRGAFLSLFFWLAAPLVHASAAVFSFPVVIFGMVYLGAKQMYRTKYRELPVLWAMYLLALTLVAACVLLMLASPAGKYLIKRALEEFTYMRSETPVNITLTIFHVGILAACLFKLCVFADTNSIKRSAAVAFLLSLIAFLIVSYFLKMNGVGLLVDRLLVYSFGVLPFVLAIRSSWRPTQLHNFSWLLMIFIFIGSFFFALNCGRWSYDNLGNVLLVPFWNVI